MLFDGQAQCSTCHVPPLFTEPGWNLHPPSQIGIDSFEADRSPTHMYRTTPLAGLWTHQKGGFFHDGRFPTLLAVVQHYNQVFNLGLTPAQENDLVQYLLSIWRGRDRRGPMRHLYRALTVLGSSRAQRVMGIATLAGLAATVVIGLFVVP